MREWGRLFGLVAFCAASPIVGCTSLLGDFATGSGVEAGSADGGGVGGGDSTVGSDAPVMGVDGAEDASPTISDSGGGRDAPGGCLANQMLCTQGCAATSDVHTCGSCANDCTLLPHVAAAGLACSGGVCMFTCLPGYAHCSTKPSDGCETDISAASHCGSCTATCAGNTPVCSPSGGTFACASGCPTGTTLCSGSCANLASDDSHCGSCTTACTGGTTCQSSSCACPSPMANCGGTCYAVASDPNHCGPNCTQCPAAVNGVATCNGGGCGANCNPGFATCGGTTPCAYNINTDPTHCGTACTACPATAPICVNGSCAACSPGTVQCSGNTVQTCDSTGAWQTTTTCATGMTCSNGACVCGPAPYVMCSSGCVNTKTSDTNCGSCNHACNTAAGAYCANGVCQACIPIKCGSGSCGCASAGGMCCGSYCC